MKKIYAFVAAVAAASTMANAQFVVTSDYDVVMPWDVSDEYSPDGLTVIGATATVKDFALNVAGFPKSYSTSGEWHPITLSNGAAVKFFDEPTMAYPSADNWTDSEVSEEYEWTWDDCAIYASTSINNDWVVEGTGNAIYLDSYCEFNGTITGSGELTIYVSNNSVLNMQCGNTHNEITPAFQGVIYIKTLDGYTCDTINVGTNFKVGQLGSGAMNNKTYAGSCTTIDLTSFGGNIVWKQNGANSLVYPAIVGAGEILCANYPYFNGVVDAEGNPVCHEYDAKITLGGSTTHDFEVYGNDLAFNGQITGAHRYMYVRSSAAVYINSKEPSCSEFTNDLSQRGTGFTGGTGYADISYWPNGGRVNTLSPGYPYWEVGQMTFKVVHVGNSNVVRFDLDNEGHSDILNVVEGFTMNAGQNEVVLGLPAQFAPKAGNYKVINGPIDAGMSTYVDTIGYEVWDNNGSTYCIRSVKGGELIVDAVTGEERVAAPGDSIGAASFGNLASKYGATIMDGNRPHYVIANWGAGTFSNGEAPEDYKNTEDPALYTPSAEQMGTAFSDPDSTKWEAAWQQFLADHPCSDPRVAVGTDDPSVIPGTVTDSIFLTYSLRLNEEGSWVGHSWSWKNGSGSESDVKGYPYAGAITYAYYYYSNNSVRLYGTQSSNFITEAGDTIAISFAQQAYPLDETIYDSADSTEFHVVKRWHSAWSGAVPQADGTSLRYRINMKNYISDGIIAIETQTVDAEGNVLSEDLYGDKVDEILNSDDLDDIKTLLKETHAVKTRAIYTLDGKRVNTYQNGINVVTVEYTDGTVETKKVVF